MKKEKIQEFTRRISGANKTELVVIVFEIALCHLKDAKEALAAGDKVCFRKELRLVRRSVKELLEGLDYEYGISYHLMSLYHYVNRELAAAGVQEDLEAVERAETTLHALQRSFQQLAGEDKTAPVMDNAQTVYAGLTYGRNDLTENLSDQGSLRGFRV